MALSVSAAEHVVEAGTNLVFDGETLLQDDHKALTNGTTTLVVNGGGTVTIKEGITGWSAASGVFACAIRLEETNSTLVLKNWYAFKTLAGRISGKGVVRCDSGNNGLAWTNAPHTVLSGDLTGFTGSLELGDMQLAVTKAQKVAFSRVSGKQKDAWTGAGLELASGVELKTKELEGDIWVRGADGTSAFAFGKASENAALRTFGAVALEGTDPAGVLPRLTVSTNAAGVSAVTLRGGNFGRVEGAAGPVRIAGETHLYKPASNMSFTVANGGKLEYGNAAVLRAADPVLWLDAARTNTLQQYVVADKNGQYSAVYTNDYPLVRRWNDRRAGQTALYGLNPYGKGYLYLYPYLVREACNGQAVLSFGRQSGTLEKKYAFADSKGQTPDWAWTVSENRRLPFNRAVPVKTTVMMYSSANGGGGTLLGGYKLANEGNASDLKEGETFDDGATTLDSLADFFSRNWGGDRVLNRTDVPVRLDGAKAETEEQRKLNGTWQILTLDSVKENGEGVPVRALGTLTDDGANCGGQIYGEILLFTNALTAVQRLAAEAYLAAKWRVPGYELALRHVQVEDGGVFAADTAFLPNGMGLGRDLAFTVDATGTVVDALRLGAAEVDAYQGGTVTVDFGTEKPQAGVYRLISAGRIHRLDAAKWTLKTEPLNGRKVLLAWEKDASGQVMTGLSVKVVAQGFALHFR